MALYLSQNFVSAQYLENKWTDFHQILFMHSYWPDLALDWCMSFFSHLYQSYGPWFTPKFCFRSISWEQMDRISLNFIYAFILTSLRSTLGLLQIIFPTFLPELWPLIYAKISFLFNTLITNGQNFTKFYICIHIDEIYLGIVTHHFSHICTWVMVLDKRQNFISVQYLEIKWTEFHQMLYMQSYWQDLRWDCNASFFAHLFQSYGPWFTPKFCFCSISWEQMDRFWPNFINYLYWQDLRWDC